MRRILTSCPLLLLLFLLAALPRAGATEEGWKKRFSATDPDEVFQSIQQAAEAKDPSAAIPLLDAGYETTYPHLSIACGEALHTMAWPGDDKEQRRAAEHWLDKASKAKDDAALMRLARVLGAWGDPIVDEELATLASGRRTPELQTEALMMCGRIRPTKDAPFKHVKDAVLKGVKGRVDEVKVAACAAAAHVGDASFFESLAGLVRKEKGAYPGLFAVWALRRLGYADGIGPFLHVLTAGSPKRETAQANLKAVTDLASLADLPDLLALTKHSQQDFRDAAALAISHLAWRGGFAASTTPDAGAKASSVPPEVIERLVSMVEGESSWEARDAARQALIRIGRPAQEILRTRLPKIVESSAEDAELTGMELSGMFGVSEASKALSKAAVFDKSRTVRMFAARALEGADPTQAVKELGAAASNAGKKPRDYEMNAVRALGYIRVPAAFETLLGLIESHSDNDVVMREVQFALERLTGHRFGPKPDLWRKWFAAEKDPLHTMLERVDRSANRRQAIEKGLYGLAHETERSVESGLRWLELQQHPIGDWDGNEKGFGGVVGCEPAYTGLALLAFLGAGYHAQSGKYSETIRRAAEFLAATQYYDGGYPVTGGGDKSWIFAYVISMGVWGVTETYSIGGFEEMKAPAQWGIDYLARVQTPGGGWRYGPRYSECDTSCTSWVLMTMKSGMLAGLYVPQRAIDGIDSWLERCAYDITGEYETPDDMSSDYDYEVGARRYFKAFTGYFELSGQEKSALQQTSMTAAGMACRFFMGWHRSHPYMIGSANYLMDYLPTWMKGLERGQTLAWYHYFWYYGTLAMYQMGGRYWRAWNDKIKRMYPEHQRVSPPDLAGSWDPDTAVLNGGRLFSTSMSVLTLETYYRFSPLLGE